MNLVRPVAFLCGCLALLLWTDHACAQSEGRLSDLLNRSVKDQANGALALLGFSVIPNETASAISVETGTPSGSQFLASQLGGAFTVSDEVPLYLEGFIAVARYDPKFVFSRGTTTSTFKAKWTTVSGTVGAGWDFPLTEEVVVRPIANFALGHVESDLSVLGRVIEQETGRSFDFLDNGKLDAYGYGGALMLDWERYRDSHEIDVELRYTQIQLKSFTSSSNSVEGEADAITLGLWSRLRVPTGWTAFESPVRAVGEFSAARFLGDQQAVLLSRYLLQIGFGLELDLGEVPWVPLTRARLMGRYVFGENSVDGFALGIGLSF